LLKKILALGIFGVAKEQSSWQGLRRNSAQKQILREEFLRMFSALKKKRSSAILGGKTARKIVVVRRISRARKSELEQENYLQQEKFWKFTWRLTEYYLLLYAVQGDGQKRPFRQCVNFRCVKVSRIRADQYPSARALNKLSTRAPGVLTETGIWRALLFSS
jgi:hypothetical protein